MELGHRQSLTVWIKGLKGAGSWRGLLRVENLVWATCLYCALQDGIPERRFAVFTSSHRFIDVAVFIVTRYQGRFQIAGERDRQTIKTCSAIWHKCLWHHTLIHVSFLSFASLSRPLWPQTQFIRQRRAFTEQPRHRGGEEACVAPSYSHLPSCQSPSTHNRPRYGFESLVMSLQRLLVNLNITA